MNASKAQTLEWFQDAEQSFQFYKIVYEIQPQIIINHRIGNEFGDYRIPGDNKIPADLDSLTKPWETVGTFNNSWGFQWIRPGLEIAA